MRWLPYPLYERHLLRAVSDPPLPNHVGVILDGNRRYARERRLTETYEIYCLGARKPDRVLDRCDELRIRAVTLWACSTENLRRSPEEVSGILATIEEKLGAIAEHITVDTIVQYLYAPDLPDPDLIIRERRDPPVGLSIVAKRFQRFLLLRW